MSKWSGHYKKLILNLLPKDGSPIRMAGLLKKSNLSSATLCKYLDQLVNEGSINRERKSHKEVFYRRTERGKIELALIKIHEEAFTILSELKEIKTWGRNSHIHTELGDIEIKIVIEKK